MAEIEVELPSGLKGIVRGIKMREFKRFSDRRGMRSGAVYDDILKECWIETTQNGPYKNGPMWASNVLQGDRLVALMGIRRATHGDIFDFTIPCGQKSCRGTIAWRVNLIEEFPMKPYPKIALTKHFEKQRFTSKLAGRVVEYGVLDTSDEKLLNKITADMSDEERALASISFRFKKVEGCRDRDAINEWFEDLELGDVLAFRDELDQITGGVDTTFEVECKHCGVRNAVELPFGGKDFWTPAKKPNTPKVRAASSTSSEPTTSTDGERSSTDSATSPTGDPDTGSPTET